MTTVRSEPDANVFRVHAQGRQLPGQEPIDDNRIIEPYTCPSEDATVVCTNALGPVIPARSRWRRVSPGLARVSAYEDLAGFVREFPLAARKLGLRSGPQCPAPRREVLPTSCCTGTKTSRTVLMPIADGGLGARDQRHRYGQAG